MSEKRRGEERAARKEERRGVRRSGSSPCPSSLLAPSLFSPSQARRPLLRAARWCIVAAAVWTFGAAAHAQAQDSSPFDSYGSREVRRSAQEILSSPEFRHFKRLDRGENGRRLGSGGEGAFPGGTEGSRGSGRRSGRSDGGNSGGSSSAGPDSGTGADDSVFGGDGSGGNDAGTSNGAQPPGESTSISLPIGGGVPGVGLLFHAIAWALLAVVVGFILFLVVKAFQNYEETNRPSELTGGGDLQGDVEPERPPGELPADSYLAEARRLAAAGKYREAVAQLLLGAMSYTERAGLIRFRRGLTHHDYLRAVRGEQGLYAAMQAIVRIYEPLGFGRRTPAAEHFDQSLSRYQRAFGGAPPGEG